MTDDRDFQVQIDNCDPHELQDFFSRLDDENMEQFLDLLTKDIEMKKIKLKETRMKNEQEIITCGSLIQYLGKIALDDEEQTISNYLRDKLEKCIEK